LNREKEGGREGGREGEKEGEREGGAIEREGDREGCWVLLLEDGYMHKRGCPCFESFAVPGKVCSAGALLSQ
jgi:hypothetical protein